MNKLFFLGILFFAPEAIAMGQLTSEDSENNLRIEQMRAQQQERAFFQAAATGDTTTCQDLLALGLNPNTADQYGRTALHYAALKGFVETVYFLLEAGASLTAVDVRGNTPLHLLLVDVSDLRAPLRKEIIKLAVYMVRSRGANLRAKNLQGIDPLDVPGIRDFESSEILHRVRSKRYRN